MSPRSEEFMAEAKERLEAASALLERGLLGAAVSEAYYAMPYAARAALSERDRSGKTHGGTWNLFHEEFFADGSFDAEGGGALRRRRRLAARLPVGGVPLGLGRLELHRS